MHSSQTSASKGEQKPLKIKLESTELKPKYEGENFAVNPTTGKESWCWPYAVKYLDSFERLKYKVKVKNGKLYDKDGIVIDTSNAGTLDYTSGKAIFVMDNEGNIFLSNIYDRGYFHHSSFVSGQPVSGAGEIKVINGVIKEINISSGHYEPTLNLNKQVIEVLKEKGVDTKKINLTDEY